MDHIAAVRAALRATAPVVAIPIEGHAPICLRAKLLKGALKGVTITSVALLDNRWLQITGTAEGGVHTSCKFAPMERNTALGIIWNWNEKERKKRIKVINQGILSAQEQRELKKAKIEAEADTALKAAQREETEILAAAKAHVNPVLSPVDPEIREDILNDYRAYREQQRLRKVGSTILWRIKTLKAELAKITVQKGKRRERKKTFARRQADIPKMLLMMREVASLEKKFESLIQPVWKEREYWPEGGYWIDSWIAKRPKEQACRGENHWRGEDRYNLKAEALKLKEARANIRALTPPKDETEDIQIAA
jgi:hypothetical protein